MRLTRQESPVRASSSWGEYGCVKGRLYSGCHIFLFVLYIRSKIQIMSIENKIEYASGNFVICDIQQEYSEYLFCLLEEYFSGSYQFHLFCEPERLKEFLMNSKAEILLTCEEYEDKIGNTSAISTVFILTEIPGRRVEPGHVSVFRYQSADNILKTISRETERKSSYNKERETVKIRDSPQTNKLYITKKGENRIREEPVSGGLIGIYSPVHRIGKTKFALNLGKQMAESMHVLYLNLEGYSGGSCYFKWEEGKDLGDLLYSLRQEGIEYGICISSMAGQNGKMDYILPMKHEQDLRAVRKDDWMMLFDMIEKECIYDAVLLDLGDCVDGLYDILRRCSRVYTPYITETAAMAKLSQYEENLNETGYGEILRHTVKRKMKRSGTVQNRMEGMA